jgi:aspartate carbamoyltransferase catalytic subunit
MKHLLTMSQLELGEIFEILDEAQSFLDGRVWTPGKEKFVANLFFEPSTRTKFSFEIAEKNLDYKYLIFKQNSPAVKRAKVCMILLRLWNQSVPMRS